MSNTTKGIILNQFKYSESSIIVNVLTEEHGKMSFIVNGVRKKKSRMPASYFQAFNILQINYILSKKSDLHKVTEVSNNILLQNIVFDIEKSSICMFLAEFINHSLNTQEPDKKFYTFLETLIQFIDQAESEYIKNIHLWTLFRLMQLNGIHPESNYSDFNCYFNPITASYTNLKMENPQIFDRDITSIFHQLSVSKVEESHTIVINREQRRILLEKILDYFKIHIDGFKTSKSLQILTEIFD
jgi:DNA repair protein RecO (recombination protein O)